MSKMHSGRRAGSPHRTKCFVILVGEKLVVPGDIDDVPACADAVGPYDSVRPRMNAPGENQYVTLHLGKRNVAVLDIEIPQNSTAHHHSTPVIDPPLTHSTPTPP